MVTRRNFIKSGLIFVPAYAHGQLATVPNRRAEFTLSGQAWAAAVVRLGGALPSLATIKAISTFYDNLIAAGLRDKFYSLNCIVPDSLTAALVPIIYTLSGSGTGYELWVNHNFVSGDLTVNGLKGDGISKYLDTGIIPPGTTPSTDFGMTIVSPDSASNGGVTESEFGSINTANSNNNTVFYLNNGGNSYVESCGFGSGWNIQVTPQPGNGYYSANRLSTTDFKLYFANQATPHAQVGSATTATGNALNSILYAFAVRNTATGLAHSYSAKRMSFIAAHAGFTSAESAAFYSLIATLRTSLGGGNP
jgi:hypothetical protein